MKAGGRIAAAIEILTAMEGRHRPAAEALKDWGKAHRFAGSADRHAIGTLVYDTLRHRNSLGHYMNDNAPRPLVLAAIRMIWKRSEAELDAALAEEHGPAPLSERERERLSNSATATGKAWIDGDIPEWLGASFARAFGEQAAAQGAALADRAPVDLRTNTLKASREAVIDALRKFGAKEGPLSPLCVRIPAPEAETRNSNVEAEPAHGLGWFEVQDAASQVASLLAGAKPGETIADICAGAGGKTLALAAAMGNEGKLFAYDQDRFRLRPIFERLQRAGVNNVEIVPADDPSGLDARAPFDRVLIDAPCSGSGAWRRKPDAKWRLTEKLLQQRIADQRKVLERGARLVKAGGALIYITCSVLVEENGDQVDAFLKANPQFRLTPFAKRWQETIGTPLPASAARHEGTLTLTPANHETDGFFIALMQKA